MSKNACGDYKRHAYIVANVSQVIQCGVPEYYVCIRCRKPKPRQNHPHLCSFPDATYPFRLPA